MTSRRPYPNCTVAMAKSLAPITGKKAAAYLLGVNLHALRKWIEGRSRVEIIPDPTLVQDLKAYIRGRMAAASFLRHTK